MGGLLIGILFVLVVWAGMTIGWLERKRRHKRELLKNKRNKNLMDNWEGEK